nr:reverse transcriptase domain-containing protein [Tanacetum cinerariifolium]
MSISLKRTGRDRDGRVIILPPTTADEHIAIQRESKARTTLPQSILDDHVADFHYMDDARDIWIAIKARMQKILSQLNQLKAKPEDEDINLKFLRALPSSWPQVALTLKTKGGLEFLSFDDWYYKLKTLEVDVKGYITFFSSQSTDPSHSTFVSTTSANKKMSYGDSLSYSSTTTYTAPSNFKTGSHKPDRKIRSGEDELAIANGYAFCSTRRRSDATRVNKETYHDGKSDGVIASKEFGMIAGCDTVDLIKEGAAKIYNLITGADTEEARTAGRPLFNRLAKFDSMKVVPPPLSRDYISLLDHINLDESQMSYGTKSSTSSDSKYVSNDFVSCDDSDKSLEVNTNDFASIDSNVKSSEPKLNDSTSCTSTSSEQMVNMTVGIGVRPVHSRNKVNHQNQFVPQAVLFRTGKLNIPPVRPQPVPTGKPKENPFPDVKDEGVFDSGCSRSMTGNKERLDDFQVFQGGKVTFGGGEDIECLMLFTDFKLLDESMVVLRVPRKNNLYTINLNNLCPGGNLACLVANASVDESVKWHRRMGHLNYKNMNRLVKGNLVRGLHPKLFKNDHTCVAFVKISSFAGDKSSVLERPLATTGNIESLTFVMLRPSNAENVSPDRRSKQPFILEESPVDTTADQHTMAELLRAPIEGYAEAIVVPSILAEQYELKHNLINMMTLDQFFGLEKDNPQDHICCGAHPYYQCLAADGNTFPEHQDNIQGYVAAVAVNYNQDPGKFLIPCGFSELKCKVLADLGASINLMPLFVWKKLGLPELISTCMTFKLANRAFCTSAGIARDVFVPIGKFTFTADLVIVDYESDTRFPLILGRPFLRTARALIDVHGEEMILRDGDERLTLNMRHDTSSYSNEPQKESINMINIFNDSCEDFLEDLFATNHQSGNPTFSSHTNLTSPEVKDDIFDLEGGNDMDSILEDSIDESNLVDLNDNLIDTMPDMFIDKHALDHPSPPLYDEYDDDLFEVKPDTEYVYDDPFDSKGEKIKESILLIDDNDPLRSSDFLPSPNYDSFLFEDFSKVDALPLNENKDKVFNPGILIQENLFEVITHVAPDKNVKKISMSHASLILKDFDPPLYELWNGYSRKRQKTRPKMTKPSTEWKRSKKTKSFEAESQKSKPRSTKVIPGKVKVQSQSRKKKKRRKYKFKGPKMANPKRCIISKK